MDSAAFERKGERMRMSQLAAEAGVSVATVKFYQRQGLLHAGALTSATQAQYDATHVQRLRLVRALLGPAGLSVTAARDVLHGVDHPPASAHDLLGVAHHALGRPVAVDVDPEPVRALLGEWGWPIVEDPDAIGAVAEALRGMAAAGFALPPGLLARYAAAMMDVAQGEVAGIPTESADAATRYVVLGTVLAEPLLLALRRLAQETASAIRFGTRRLPADPR